MATDPVDDVLVAIDSYTKTRAAKDRERLRAALKRWVKREIRQQVLDGEGYPG